MYFVDGPTFCRRADSMLLLNSSMYLEDRRSPGGRGGKDSRPGGLIIAITATRSIIIIIVHLIVLSLYS